MRNCFRCNKDVESGDGSYIEAGDTKETVTKEFNYLVVLNNLSKFHKSIQKLVKDEKSRNNPITEVLKISRNGENINSLKEFYKQEAKNRKSKSGEISESSRDSNPETSIEGFNKEINTNKDITIDDLSLIKRDHVGNEDKLVENNNNPVVGTFYDTEEVQEQRRGLVCGDCVAETDTVIW